MSQNFVCEDEFKAIEDILFFLILSLCKLYSSNMNVFVFFGYKITWLSLLLFIE